jgi:hypothetical protein
MSLHASSSQTRAIIYPSISHFLRFNNYILYHTSMNEIEKSIVEQSIALLNNSFSADDQTANRLVRDAISRLEGLLERKD